MEPYKRHPIILDLLRQMGEVTVDDLARRLNVSENTIRNDLTALESRDLLIRVRGGAIPADKTGNVNNASLSFSSRTSAQHDEKRRIGAWAAQLVADGDTLVIDASSTAYQLGTFLNTRINLTVLTNGLHLALLLSQNPSNRVMLASNTVGPDGFSTVGSLNADIKQTFRASKAFISCSGLTPEWGLAEIDMAEATLKAQMIDLAGEVIALADHTKFGRIEPYRSVALDRIDRIVTDDRIPPDSLEAMRAASGFPITVVAVDGVRTIQPAPAREIRIGFGNLSERMSFARQVRRSLQDAVAHLPNVELLIRDNDLSREKALHNAGWFIENDVDLVIEYQVDHEAANIIMDKFNRAGIPVIAVDIDMAGATFFGADNYRAGFMAGEYLGAWIRDHWQSRFDLLLKLEAARVGPASQARLQGAQDGLEAIIGRVPADHVRSIMSLTLVEDTEAATTAALECFDPNWRIAITAVNDEAAVGALRAFEAAGRLQNVVAVGQNVDEVGEAALRQSHLPLIASTRYGPETYGPKLLDAALKIVNHQRVPPAVYIDHMLIHRGNLERLPTRIAETERG